LGVVSGLAQGLASVPDPTKLPVGPKGPQLLALTAHKLVRAGGRLATAGCWFSLSGFVITSGHPPIVRMDQPQQPAVARGDPVNGIRSRMSFTG